MSNDEVIGRQRTTAIDIMIYSTHYLRKPLARTHPPLSSMRSSIPISQSVINSQKDCIKSARAPNLPQTTETAQARVYKLIT